MRVRPLLAILFACALGAPFARAEPTAADRTIARSLFDEGRALVKSGEIALACPKLEASYKLDPGIGTLFNLADCFEQSGRTASAWTAFSEVAETARRNEQAERASLAQQRADALAPRLSKVRLMLAPPLPPELVVQLDGKPLGIAILGTELPMDPGPHVVALDAPGYRSVTQPLIVDASAAVKTLELPALEKDVPEPTPTAPPLPARAAHVAPAAPPRHESEWGWQKTAAAVAGGASIVGVGLGSIFGLRANSEWSSAQEGCPSNRCSEAGYSHWENARSSATISNVAFGAGLVLAATAVTLWLTAPPRAGQEPRSARLIDATTGRWRF